MKKILPLCLFSLAFIILVPLSPVFPWSSIDQTGTGGAVATHQFLNEEAYNQLQKHPAFKNSGFPALGEIQRFSGTNARGIGAGPDGDGNSLYSWHYYNPLTGEGKAPEIVQEYYDYLKDNLAGKKDIRDSRDHASPPARNAAYSAHFIQDMTCPFHVIGLMGSEVSPDKVLKEKYSGPYGDFEKPEEWKKVVERYQTLKNPDADWFDPTYYDGAGLGIEEISPWIVSSTHVLYEGFIELKYKSTFAASFMEWNSAKKGGVIKSPFWANDSFKAMTERMAKVTKDKLGTKAAPGKLWFDNSQMVDLTSGMLFENIGQSFEVLKVQVPLEQWQRAVEATYTLWRAAFSALSVDADSLRLVKLQNKPDIFVLKLQATNNDPDAEARSVTVDYQGENNDLKAGRVSAGSLPPSESGKELDCGEISLAGKNTAEGKLLLDIKGRYSDVPDAGEKKFSYEMSAIRLDRALKMPNVLDHEGSDAQKQLSEEPYHFQVIVHPGGLAPSKEKSKRVAEQDPASNTWVAAGDTVHVTVYDRFLVLVPSVVGLEKGSAAGIIQGAELTPSQTEQEAGPEIAPFTVIRQSPAAGEEVEPGTAVSMIIAKPSRENPKPETPVEENAVEAPEDPSVGPVTSDPLIGRIILTPAAATITTAQTLAITAQTFGLDGTLIPNPLERGFQFSWMVNDPSLASISGQHNNAVFSPISTGVVHVLCSAGGAFEMATITVKDEKSEDGFEDSQADWNQTEGLGSDSGFSDSGESWQSSEILPEPAPEEIMAQVQEQPQRPSREEQMTQMMTIFGGMMNMNTQMQRIQNIRSQSQSTAISSPVTTTGQRSSYPVTGRLASPTTQPSSSISRLTPSRPSSSQNTAPRPTSLGFVGVRTVRDQ